MDCGYFFVELRQLELSLDKLPAKDLSLRLDVDITEGLEVFKWESNNDKKFSTSVIKPTLQESPPKEEGDESTPVFSYILGFDDLTQKSIYIDLNNDVISGLANATLKIKVISINEADAPAATKPAKGAAPPPVTPLEEVMFELSLPFFSLFTTSSSAINIFEPLSEISSLNVSILNNSVVGNLTKLNCNIVCDNDMAEYVLGCKILKWDSAQLVSPPAAWGLKYADVIDPKAKIQPTAADLRAKYLENIVKVVANQNKVAKFTLSVGTVANEEEGVVPLIPLLELANGTITYDSETAQSVPVEEDIRARRDLWSIAWSNSQVLFFHRSAARKFLSSFLQDPSSSLLSLSLKKVPFPEFAAAEGPELSAVAEVNIAEIVSPGTSIIELNPVMNGENFDTSATDLKIYFSSNIPLVPTPMKDIINNSTAKVSDIVSNKEVSSDNPNRDIMKELRDEISSTVERIAQEYISLYPTPPTTNNTNNTDASLVAISREEKKMEFLSFLINNGIFHELKENLKVKVQLLIRHKFGARGRALGKSETMKAIDLRDKNANRELSEDDNNIYDEKIETALSELYVFLSKECSIVLNSMFSETIIERDVSELNKNASINDEESTKLQEFYRLLNQAVDAAADLKFDIAESIHQERIQLVTHNASLGSDQSIIHTVYANYGEFLLNQAGVTTNPSTVFSLQARAREVLAISYNADKSDWKIALLYACILIECDQPDEAEYVIHSVISSQLSGKCEYTLQSLNEFDGYESEKLCPIDYKCHCILATLFSMQKLPIRARKALNLANRSFIEGEFQPPVSTHGSPKRTIVLCLSETSIYLFQYSFSKLGKECLSLAIDCENAVTEKAKARGKAAVTVPHIRYLLKKAQSLSAMLSEDVSELQNAISFATESEIVSDDSKDKITALLTLAKAQTKANVDSSEIINTYLNAMKHAVTLPIEVLKEENLYSLESFISLNKILLNTGRFTELIQILMFECTIYSSSILFCQFGICSIRLNQIDNAEQAFIEANLLDNRNAETWAYLSLLCMICGPHRTEEAEKSLYQALRLGLNNPNILRELATSYMAIDNLQIAEDLIRRAMSKENKDFFLNNKKQNPYTRKLLADILASQNQAITAIDEYQIIIGDESVDKYARIEAAEKCSELLSSLGREEELKSLRKILNTLNSSLENVEDSNVAMLLDQ